MSGELLSHFFTNNHWIENVLLSGKSYSCSSFFGICFGKKLIANATSYVTAQPGVAVSSGKPQQCLRSSREALRPWAGEVLRRGSREDQDICMSKSRAARWRTQGPAQKLPQPFHAGDCDAMLVIVMQYCSNVNPVRWAELWNGSF